MSGGDHAICPVCRVRSHSRHSSYRRTLRDLPAQGTPVEVRAKMTRWRCRNDRCERRIFAERIPGLAAPFARRTTRLAGIVRLFGHSAGGRPSERLMARLDMLVGHCTILREVKRSAQTDANAALVRVAGIDDWAWKKGMNYGTVIVDLERRQVVDVLSDRSAASTAEWLKRHPTIEVISRDRAGLYAEGAREGAPQTRQVADRFHLLQNFREAVERRLTHPGGPAKRSSDSIPKGADCRRVFEGARRQLAQRVNRIPIMTPFRVSHDCKINRLCALPVADRHRDPMPIYARGAVQKSGASSPNETNELFRLSWNEASARSRNCASWPFSIRRRNQLLHFCNAPRIFAMRLPHLIDPRNPRDYRPNDVSLSNMAKVFDSSERRLDRSLPVCIAGFNCGFPPTCCEGAPLCRLRRGHNRGRRNLPCGGRR